MTNSTAQPVQLNKHAPDLSIVLVCWNNKDYLAPCLDSLYGAGLRSSFDVLVVDNGSKDGSQVMLREKFPQVILIQNDDNLGLGKASNQGIEASNGKYVLLLNNDTIVNGHSIDAMVEFLDAHPETGAAGGRLLNPDGSVQSCYCNFSTLLEEFLVATRVRGAFLEGLSFQYYRVSSKSGRLVVFRLPDAPAVGVGSGGVARRKLFHIWRRSGSAVPVEKSRLVDLLPARFRHDPLWRSKPGPVALPEAGVSRQDAVLPEALWSIVHHFIAQLVCRTQPV